MSFMETGKTIADSAVEVTGRTIEVKIEEFSVRDAGTEYPSRFGEAAETYNPYDSTDPYFYDVDPQDVPVLDFDPYKVFDTDDVEYGRDLYGDATAWGGKIHNITEMLNSDPAVQETGGQWTMDDVKNIFDDYAKADAGTQDKIIENLTDRLNADPKLKEIGELWTPQDVKDVFFTPYNEEQAIKDLNSVIES